MLERFWGGRERRRHTRHPAALQVDIEVEVYGFEGDSRPFFASGNTINISRGGLLARLDAPVSRGSVCNVFFRNAGRQVRPQHTAAQVMRSQEIDGGFLVAVRFEELLLQLDVHGPPAPSAAVRPNSHPVLAQPDHES